MHRARKYGISRMDKLRDAKKKCPDLVVQHVATYKEGDAEPGYWDHIDSRTHKVRYATPMFRSNFVLTMTAGFFRSLPS